MTKRPTTRRGRITRAELEGFWAGLAHALARRRRDGVPDTEAERALDRADLCIKSGRLGEAEGTLITIDRRLARATPERELLEFPRGLQSYVATDGPESPTPSEDDPLRNRLLVIERLAAVRAAGGGGVVPVLGKLAEAFMALDRGERRWAEELGEEAHALLERSPGSRAGGREPDEQRRES